MDKLKAKKRTERKIKNPKGNFFKIKIPFDKTKDGIIFKVKVEPRSSKRHIAGLHADALKIKLTGPPVEGRANEELIELLSDTFRIRKSAIRILKGTSSKQKLVFIGGIEELKIPE